MLPKWFGSRQQSCKSSGASQATRSARGNSGYCTYIITNPERHHSVTTKPTAMPR